MHTSTAPVRALLGAGLAGVVAFTGAVTTATTATADTQTGTTATSATEKPGELLLMLDASGSMKESDPAGGTKMQAAKKALTGVVDSLPSDAHVGLRVYGATEPGGKPTKAACNDTQLAVPIGPLDKPALTKAIKGFEAKGETPIAHSLTKAMDDLGDTGKRNIVLVSDGEESCVPDPCPVVKDLVQDGVDLRIDTVGFGVKDPARKQLQCIAETGGGTYYDAANADELATSLNKISTRAVRDFAFTGQPVTGTDLAEGQQPPADLPTLTPGLWRDELTANADSWRAYTVERTQKNSTLHVSATTKPSTYDHEGGHEDLSGVEELTLKILAPDGTECVRTYDNAGENSQKLSPIATVTGRLLGQTLENDERYASCRAEGAFTVLVNRRGPTRTTPAEIQVIEEPRVTNLDELPEAVEEHPEEVELTTGKEQPVTGGLSFSDAPEITEGTWVDTLVPGETLLYRVKVEDGQIARFTANGPTGGFRFPEDSGNLWVDGSAFGPDRQQVGDSIWIAGHFSDTYGNNPKSVTTAPVRYKNRYSSADDIGASSMSGWYYYAVGIGKGDLGQDLAGQPIKIAFTVDIEGKPSNAVEYATEEDWDAAATGEKNDASGDTEGDSGTSDDTAATGSEGEGDSPLPWIGGGLLAAIVLGAGAWFGIRRLGKEGN
ncbi:VWA domain-containing protein [Janibacter sp. DB-40]|uniref:VWA domain-containing protein n=1 Tax=Janibacter sp. DB-40 TaxID=3028808 RepID=UPI0024073A65|nr:VWA domain-containing protein [Janibacter sp. DB-40]